jgi:uncharacterized protein YkwD
VKGFVIGSSRLPFIAVVLLTLVSVWTTPAFSMGGSNGVVALLIKGNGVGSVLYDEEICDLNFNPAPEISTYLHLSDPFSECPTSFEQQIVFFINYQRNLVGLSPLELDLRLQEAARGMSDDMAVSNNVPADHVDSLGRTFDIRVSEVGGYPYTHLGEVIAGGFSSPEAVVNAWMNSPRHKARLLDPDYIHIGVGYTLKTNTDHWYYWTADLGSTNEPRQAPTLDCDPGFFLLFLSLIQE